MAPIDRPGTFRGTLEEYGVGETKKNGYPQFVVRLKATEYFDEEGVIPGPNNEAGKPETWVPWPYDQEITAYLVLYTRNAKTGQWEELLNAKQLQAALGWKGDSFATLANGNYQGQVILFRVEQHEYEGKSSLQVSWVDSKDANPIRQLPKYDTGKLQGLDTKFAAVLKKAPAGPPTSVPKTAAKPKGKPGRPTAAANQPPGTSGKPVVPAQNAPVSVTGTTPPVTVSPLTPAPSSPPATAPAAPKSDAPFGDPRPPETTKEEAWKQVNVSLSRDLQKFPDDKLAEVWVEEVVKVSNGDEDKITPTQWAEIRDAVGTRTCSEDIPF
jgi:hypothetical protein